MCRAQFVLVLVACYVGAAHSWDFAVSLGDQLIFYTSDGTKTDTVHFESHNVTAITYDEVHNRMLYVDKQSDNDTICGYYISSKENKCFLKSFGRNIRSIAYDPATEKFFFTDINKKSINWISLKPGLDSNVYDLIQMDDRTPSDIAIDSCRGYIYWCYGNNIERARLNGSGREAVVRSTDRLVNLAINTQTQKIYFIENIISYFLHSVALDGHNHGIKDIITTESKEIAVSKDYIYWRSSNGIYDFVRQYTKNHVQLQEIKFSDSILGLATNYKIDDQIKGIHDCDALSSLLPITEAPATTQRSDVSVCDNYCLQGTCSVNDEGLPKCSCNAGHTGPRCQVDVCLGYCSNNGDCSLDENREPVCQCKGDYSGHRCEISDCMNYCVRGNCSLSDEGHPTCSCDAGYSGERCEVSTCHGYCSNNGDCSLDENREPVCQCKGDYSGHRCEISDCLNYCMHGNCSLSDEGHPTCSCDAGYSGKRCEVSTCHGYCSNNGACSLNENREQVCQCKGDYSGHRCEISDCLNYCMHGNCSLSDEGHPTCSCGAGYSGERCEVSACHGYCLNDGECSLNEEDDPVCQCVGNHDGSRCEADVNETTAKYELTKRNLTLSDLLSTWGNTSSNIYLTVNNYNNFTNSSVTIGGQNGQNVMGPRPDGAQTH